MEYCSPYVYLQTNMKIWGQGNIMLIALVDQNYLGRFVCICIKSSAVETDFSS